MKLKSKLSVAVLVINFMISFIFPLGENCKIWKIWSKRNNRTTRHQSLGGDEKWALGSPLILLLWLQWSLFGRLVVPYTGQDHQAYKFQMVSEVWGASGGPGSSNSTKIGQSFLLFIHKPTQNRKKTKIEDAQKQFKSVFEHY